MKFEKVSNPLTIIGIFAGIAEIAGTAVLPNIQPGLQPVFIWYVMGFPVFLVGIFFLTLNYNPKVLYAPSDYRNDESFLAMLSVGSFEKVDGNLEQVATMLKDAKGEIIEEVFAAIEKESFNPEMADKIINGRLDVVQNKINETKTTSNSFLERIMLSMGESSVSKVWNAMDYVKGYTFDEIAQTTNLNRATVVRAIIKLEQSKQVKSEIKDGKTTYVKDFDF